MEKTGRVYLVGAGCGNADLITLKGLNALKNCDAVVYDDLIAPELLTFVPENAEKIYMGKREGRHSATQNAISQKLVELALEGKTVVRLKGGDPFVFGRVSEEIYALKDANVPFSVVPGISSAIAIPSSAGIPVTHRNLSQSVHIITAHTAGDGLPQDLKALAQLHGTIVILMGLSRIRLIVETLTSAGMPLETPAAVVSGGNSPFHATVRGTLQNICEETEKAKVKAPAIILIGAVAALNLSDTENALLSGVSVGISGTAAITEKLRSLLEDMGADVVLTGSQSIKTLTVEFNMAELGCKKSWVVLTSSNGVNQFFRHLSMQETDLRVLSRCKFAVIGSATKKALKEHGFHADLCPETYTSEALGELLLQTVKKDEPIYLFRSVKADNRLFESLKQEFEVYNFPTYDTVTMSDASNSHNTESRKLHYLAFSSADGVKSYFASNGAVPRGTKCVCIGSVTAKALKSFSDEPFLTAEEISAQGIVDAIINDVKENS